MKTARIKFYRPPENGKCENIKLTLEDLLRRAVQERPYDWKLLRAPVLQAYRSTIIEIIRFTLFRFAFRREFCFPIDFKALLLTPPRNIETGKLNCSSNVFGWRDKLLLTYTDEVRIGIISMLFRKAIVLELWYETCNVLTQLDCYQNLFWIIQASKKLSKFGFQWWRLVSVSHGKFSMQITIKFAVCKYRN